MCEAAVASLFRCSCVGGNYGKNRPSVHRPAPCLLRPTSSFLPLSSSCARSCSIFQLFFFFSPQWEHFYGNWSPCNDSSWYACSTPDSPMTSRTPRANQQPATSPTNKSPLRSPAVDAAASCHRWRQKVTDEGFTPKGDVLRIPPCVLTLLPASNNGAALVMNRSVTAN